MDILRPSGIQPIGTGTFSICTGLTWAYAKYINIGQTDMWKPWPLYGWITSILGYCCVGLKLRECVLYHTYGAHPTVGYQWLSWHTLSHPCLWVLPQLAVVVRSFWVCLRQMALGLCCFCFFMSTKGEVASEEAIPLLLVQFLFSWLDVDRRLNPSLLPDRFPIEPHLG